MSVLVLTMGVFLGLMYAYYTYRANLPTGREILVEQGRDRVFGAVTMGKVRVRNVKFKGFEYKDGEARLKFEYLKNRKVHSLEVRSTISFDVVERKFYKMGEPQIDLKNDEEVILNFTYIDPEKKFDRQEYFGQIRESVRPMLSSFGDKQYTFETIADMFSDKEVKIDTSQMILNSILTYEI